MTWDCFKHRGKIEYQNITNLLDTTLDEIPRFITKKWVVVHDQSDNAEDRFQPNKQIRFKTSMLQSDLCDFSDTYIVVKGDITLTKANSRGFIDTRSRFLAFKNNAPFTNCLSKINNVLIDNSEDLDFVMPMYNLLEYSRSYRKTIWCLWNYYRDESNNPPVNDYDLPTVPTILNLLNTKVVLQEKHQMQIKKTMKIPSQKTQRLKKSWNCCSIKIFKQFLENFRHAFD